MTDLGLRKTQSLSVATDVSRNEGEAAGRRGGFGRRALVIVSALARVTGCLLSRWDAL